MIPFGKISAMQDRMPQMPKLKLPAGRQTVVLSEGWKKGIADQILVVDDGKNVGDIMLKP